MLLADAGVGSCRGGEKNVNATFVLSASSCSCLPATLEIIATGAKGPPPRVELRCGASTSVPMSVQPSGSLLVMQGSTVWLDRSFTAQNGDQIVVPVQCPTR